MKIRKPYWHFNGLTGTLLCKELLGLVGDQGWSEGPEVQGNRGDQHQEDRHPL